MFLVYAPSQCAYRSLDRIQLNSDVPVDVVQVLGVVGMRKVFKRCLGNELSEVLEKLYKPQVVLHLALEILSRNDKVLLALSLVELPIHPDSHLVQFLENERELLRRLLERKVIELLRSLQNFLDVAFIRVARVVLTDLVRKVKSNR